MLNRLLRTASPAPKHPAPAPEAMSEGDFRIQVGIVLDALGSILNLYGKHAIATETHSVEDVRKLMHQWMQHATMGTPQPGNLASQPVGGILARDWKGLVRQFGTLRREEAAWVERSSGDLKEGIWAFIGALHKVVVSEQEENRVVTEAFERLRVAAEDGSADQLKAEAVAIAGTLDTLVQARRHRQQDQLSALAAQLRNATQELEDARRVSTLDPLTELPNRKAFDDYVARMIELHALLQQPTCLLLVDIDEFKSVNDTHGHAVGDEALQTMARSLSRAFLRKTDFVCRFAGDEFAAVLQETTIESGVLAAERLRRTLRELLDKRPEGSTPFEFSISIGVAPLIVGDTNKSWFERADKSLYLAKAMGRDRVVTAAEVVAEIVGAGRASGED